MVEELRNFKPDGYVCPCPMGHYCFEDCVDCEDNNCGDECVYATPETSKDEEPSRGERECGSSNNPGRY